MTTITKPIRPTLLPPCPRCRGRMFTDCETGEAFCVPCGHRPVWSGGLSSISNTSVDYMGDRPSLASIEMEDKREKRRKNNNKLKYGPPEGVKVEIRQWDCTVVGARIPWGEICFYPSCSNPKKGRGVCKHHYTVLTADGTELLVWREAAARQFGYVRVEYEQWEEKGKIYTRVLRVWWPSYISHTTGEVMDDVIEKFEREKGYSLRRLRPALVSKDLLLVDSLAVRK